MNIKWNKSIFAIIIMLALPSIAVFAEDDEIKLTKLGNGTWIFTKPVGKDVKIEVEYITQTDLDEAASNAIRLSSRSITVEKGYVLVATCSTTDRGTISYQWYKNSTESNEGGTMIEGATKPRHMLSVEEFGSAFYYCEVTYDNGVAVGKKKGRVLGKNIKKTNTQSSGSKKR